MAKADRLSRKIWIIFSLTFYLFRGFDLNFDLLRLGYDFSKLLCIDVTLQLVVIDSIFGTLYLLLKFNVFLVSELMKGMPRGRIPFQLGQKVAGLNDLHNRLLRNTPH